MKSESPITLNSPGAAKAFFLASRPRTWIASISPVLIGTAFAAKEVAIDWFLFALVLCFALLIQIGTNFANDYFDFVKGADSVLRKGPKRATQQGWISPPAMLRATMVVFSFASLVALPLMLRAGWWSFPITAFCILFGILYTGGPKPLGYLGLGEVLVLIFFGPVAVGGTYFLQTMELSPSVVFAGLAPGFLSCALLVANNLRDEESDRFAKKQTLIARWGRRFGSWEYASCIFLATLIPIGFAPLVFFVALFFLPLIKKAFLFKDPLELIPVLQGTGFLFWCYTILFCCGLLW